MGLLDRFRKEKPFPEKGEYQGVKYRIDGDAVMLLASTGKELQFAPTRPTPDEFDDQRLHVLQGGNAQSIRLAAQAASGHGKQTNDDTGSTRRNWVPSSLSCEENLAALQLSDAEYLHLATTAREILAGYWKSRNHKNK